MPIVQRCADTPGRSCSCPGRSGRRERLFLKRRSIPAASGSVVESVRGPPGIGRAAAAENFRRVDDAERRGSGRVYRDFSCEITVVRPLADCRSSGIYLCVAAWESTAEARTLHVLDAERYALYRVSR